MKNIRNLIRQVKLTCNLCTFTWIAYMAYTIDRWQKLSGFDNFSNILILGLIMAINIKFYLIYVELSSTGFEIPDLSKNQVYRDRKKEYRQLVRASVWMAVILFIMRLTLKTF